jgi:hypothetical protein
MPLSEDYPVDKQERKQERGKGAIGDDGYSVLVVAGVALQEQHTKR